MTILSFDEMRDHVRSIKSTDFGWDLEKISQDKIEVLLHSGLREGKKSGIILHRATPEAYIRFVLRVDGNPHLSFAPGYILLGVDYQRLFVKSSFNDIREDPHFRHFTRDERSVIVKYSKKSKNGRESLDIDIVDHDIYQQDGEHFKPVIVNIHALDCVAYLMKPEKLY